MKLVVGLAMYRVIVSVYSPDSQIHSPKLFTSWGILQKHHFYTPLAVGRKYSFTHSYLSKHLLIDLILKACLLAVQQAPIEPLNIVYNNWNSHKYRTSTSEFFSLLQQSLTVTDNLVVLVNNKYWASLGIDLEVLFILNLILRNDNCVCVWLIDWIFYTRREWEKRQMCHRPKLLREEAGAVLFS